MGSEKKKSFTILKCVHLNHILKHKLESSKKVVRK